jgi:hypothetical protein
MRLLDLGPCKSFTLWGPYSGEVHHNNESMYHHVIWLCNLGRVKLGVQNITEIRAHVRWALMNAQAQMNINNVLKPRTLPNCKDSLKKKIK